MYHSKLRLTRLQLAICTVPLIVALSACGRGGAGAPKPYDELGPAPQNVHATQGEREDGILVSWDAAPGALEYQVRRLDQSSFASVGSATEWLDNDPQTLVMAYSVRAQYADGIGQMSEAAGGYRGGNILPTADGADDPVWEPQSVVGENYSASGYGPDSYVEMWRLPLSGVAALHDMLVQSEGAIIMADWSERGQVLRRLNLQGRQEWSAPAFTSRFFHRQDGSIYFRALDKCWRFRPEGSIEPAFTTDPGEELVYAGSAGILSFVQTGDMGEGELRSRNGLGELQWVCPVDNIPVRVVAGPEFQFLVLTGLKSLYCLKDGSPRWTKPGDRNASYGSACLLGDNWLVTSEESLAGPRSSLVLLDADGEEAARRDGEFEVLAAGGDIVVAANREAGQDTISAFSSTDLSDLWEWNDSINNPVAAIDASGKVFIGGRQEHLICLGESGYKLWSSPGTLWLSQLVIPGQYGLLAITSQMEMICIQASRFTEHPAGPQNVRASQGQYRRSVRLEWDPEMEAEDFVVERDGTLELGHTGANYFVDNDCEPGREYSYRVGARSSGFLPAYSAPVKGCSMTGSIPDPAWPQPDYDSQRSRHSLLAGPSAPRLLWTASTNRAVIESLSPVLDGDGNAYVPTSLGLYCISAEGNPNWTFRFGTSQPLIGAAGRVYTYADFDDGALGWIALAPAGGPDPDAYWPYFPGLDMLGPTGALFQTQSTEGGFVQVGDELGASAEKFEIPYASLEAVGKDGSIYVYRRREPFDSNNKEELACYRPGGGLAWVFDWRNQLEDIGELSSSPPQSLLVTDGGTVYFCAYASFANNGLESGVFTWVLSPNGSVIAQLDWGEAVDSLKLVAAPNGEAYLVSRSFSPTGKYYSNIYRLASSGKRGVLVEGKSWGYKDVDGLLTDRDYNLLFVASVAQFHGQVYSSDEALVSFTPQGKQRWQLSLHPLHPVASSLCLGPNQRLYLASSSISNAPTIVSNAIGGLSCLGD